jgi:hypothetical protein
MRSTYASRLLAVSSVEPSSTTMISSPGLAAARALWTARRTSGARLRVGMMTETSGALMTNGRKADPIYSIMSAA